jgi:MFS family permease
MAGEFLSQTGSYVSAIAQSWVVLAATHDPLALGVTMAARFAPAAVLAPVIGRYVDTTTSPRTLILLANYAQAVLAVLLVFLAFTPHSLVFIPFVVVGSVSQVFSVLEHSGRMSYLTALVPDNARARFAGATNSAGTMGRIAGPAVASLLLTVEASGFCFAVDALSFVLAALALPRPQFPMDPSAPPRSLREGLQIIWSLPVVRDLLLTFSLVSLVSFNVATILPLMVEANYNNDPTMLATLNIAFGVGSVLGGLLRARVGIAPTISAFAGLVLFGSTFAAAGWSRSIVMLLVLLFASGFGRLMFTASSEATLAVSVAQGQRGLVASLYAVAFTGTTPLGALLVTSLSSGIGVRATMAVAGTVAALGGVAYALSLAVHRRLNRAAPTAEHPDPAAPPLH